METAEWRSLAEVGHWICISAAENLQYVPVTLEMLTLFSNVLYMTVIFLE